eukprot:UN17744
MSLLLMQLMQTHATHFLHCMSLHKLHEQQNHSQAKNICCINYANGNTADAFIVDLLWTCLYDD